MSVDPLLDAKNAMANPQAWNRYSYVRNRPLNLTDPDGRLVRDKVEVDAEVKDRHLEKESIALARYTFFLANEVKSGAITSKQAINMFYGRAQQLTKGTADRTGNALLLATSAALNTSVRGKVSNTITRTSLGPDTLHHFFINAFNTYEGIGNRVGVPVWIERWGANSHRDEHDPEDINANNLGAAFGDMLENGQNVLPSSIIVPPPGHP